MQGECTLAKQNLRTESDKAAMFEQLNIELDAQLKTATSEVCLLLQIINNAVAISALQS
jgi:hypothetical protein